MQLKSYVYFVIPGVYDIFVSVFAIFHKTLVQWTLRSSLDNIEVTNINYPGKTGFSFSPQHLRFDVQQLQDIA